MRQVVAVDHCCVREESYKHGLIEKSEYTYVDNIFEFTDKDVKDVMIPRTDMVCVFKEDSFEKYIING
ncbi:Hemolysins and protein containing CBS domain protein [Dehalobacter sp. UNSWDHB]|uniref:hypothetical protein n=1 Tax=unclassified Dehalobacter TaxID=2635733 RepID=UPI0003877239|nr:MULTISPECIES: hypothetical protein [unclassified Dehalobacter]EQB21589.1 Hemolysins and protein containing CBS domain protein [Dehalobacter sp. UNSWDHB]